jgi:hypothetical protein
LKEGRKIIKEVSIFREVGLKEGRYGGTRI